MELVLYSDYRKTLNNPLLLHLHNIYKTHYTNHFIDTNLLDCDASKWKDQDHYKILSLDHLRFLATPVDIKNCYRKKILNYHPDKASKTSNDYFTCITKAYEILCDPIKRRTYDSVDPYFDDSLPDFKPLEHSDPEYIYNHFYKTFNSYFELNARWSLILPIPQLGDYLAAEDNINSFYSFWYDFRSWREFSYLDKEEVEKGENRDERRWLIKQNKNQRVKLKKDESARIRKLVDLAYKNDIRVSRIKEIEKERKKIAKVKHEKFKEIESNKNLFVAPPAQSRLSSDNLQEKIIDKIKNIELNPPDWCEPQLKDLIRASEIFPVGTSERWDKISSFLSKRYPKTLFNEKLIINKIKDMKIVKKVVEQPNKIIWTTEEQKLLELGLKTVSAKDPNRWQKVSDIVISKSESDCMLRYQEILSFLKNKKL